MSTFAHAHIPRPAPRRAHAAGARRAAIAASLCLCMAVLAPAFGASPAAAIVATVGGHGYGVTPIRGVKATSIAGAYRAPRSLGRSPTPRTHRFDEAPNGGGALIDEGGPVMESNTTHVIYWDPSKEFTAATRGIVNTFFTDVAHDSGHATNVFAVDAQYGAAYRSTYAGEAIDKDAYPSSGGCSVPVEEADAGPPYTACLYDSQLQSELSAYVAAHSLPTGPTQLYFLLLPHKVVTCFEGGTECSNNVFCAYHSYINPGEAGEIIYADIPFSLLDAGDAKGCQADGNPAIQTPNGDTAGTDASTRFADVAVKYISHEYSEAITDPLVGVKTAWADSNGLENGDKCNAWNPGPGTESGEDAHAFLPTLGGSAEAGTLFDQSIDSDHYYLQSEWDNATSTCLMQPALSAIFNPPPAPAHVGAPVSFESSTVDPYGELSLEWDFGDSSTTAGTSPSHAYTAPGIYTVTMTATDALTGTISPVVHNVVVNDVPSASFTATPDPASVGAAVGFSGVASSDPDGSIASYAWDFGDGANGSGATPSHVYAAPGAYTVKLTVTDVAGETSSISHLVEVTSAGEGAGAGSGNAAGTPGAGGGSATGAGASAGATTSAGASAASSSPTSRFTILAKPSVNARTGAVIYRVSVQDPGTLSFALTFKNGRFGVFSPSARCRPGEARLKGRCAPAQVIFARSSRPVPAPGVVTLTLRPSAVAAKALENALREGVGLPVAAKVSFQSALGGPPAALTQPLTVKLASARRPHATRLALGSGAFAGAAWASGAPRAGARARAAIIGGAPATPAPASSSAPAESGGPAGAGGASASFASVVEVFDLRGRVNGQCTGTVIAPSLVLTAGHCAENLRTGVVDPAAGFRVAIGDGAPAGEQGQLATVSAVIVYERFHRRVDNGDAALLVLVKPTTAPAIRLATSAQQAGASAGSTATIAGWGNTYYGQRLPTEALRWAATVVQAPRWCARNAPPFYARSEICTIDPPSYATGACNGDSGGPLLASPDTAGEPVQIGIAVHVYDRCSTHHPSVFTRVDSIAAWLRSWMAAYTPSAPAPPGPVPAPGAGL